MDPLKSFSSLVKMADQTSRIGSITLRFGFEKPDQNRGRDYIYQWQASLLDARDGLIVGSGADAIEDACTSLLSICNERYSHIPKLGEDAIFINPDQIEKIILQLKKITPSFGEAFISLYFTYWSPFQLSSSRWKAGVLAGSHWQNRSIAKVEGYSFIEVCTELLKLLQKLEQ